MNNFHRYISIIFFLIINLLKEINLINDFDYTLFNKHSSLFYKKYLLKNFNVIKCKKSKYIIGEYSALYNSIDINTIDLISIDNYIRFFDYYKNNKEIYNIIQNNIFDNSVYFTKKLKISFKNYKILQFKKINFYIFAIIEMLKNVLYIDNNINLIEQNIKIMLNYCNIKINYNEELNNLYLDIYNHIDWSKALIKSNIYNIQNMINEFYNKLQNTYSFLEEAYYKYDIIISNKEIYKYINLESLYYELLYSIDNHAYFNKDLKLISIHEIYNNYKLYFIIPKIIYKQVIKYLLNEVSKKYYEINSDFKRYEKLLVYFEDNRNNVSEAYAIDDGFCRSKIYFNLYLPITIAKAIQLVSHEYTHHVNNCVLLLHKHNLIRNKIITKTDLKYNKYKNTNLMSFIYEGIAEHAVDIIFSYEEKYWLIKEILLKYKTYFNVNQLLKLYFKNIKNIIESHLLSEKIINKLWKNYVIISKMLNENKIDIDKCNYLLLKNFKHSMTWPNCSFFNKYKSYIAGYIHGKELIENYINKEYIKLNKSTNKLKLLTNFMQKPILMKKLNLLINK